jgi:hypothetical protein
MFTPFSCCGISSWYLWPLDHIGSRSSILSDWKCPSECYRATSRVDMVILFWNLNFTELKEDYQHHVDLVRER